MSTVEPLHVVLIVIGLALLVRGLMITLELRRVPPGPARNTRRMMALARGFRWTVIAVGFGGSGLGLALDESWLFWFSLVFGIEELYEATLILGALKRVERVELRRHRASVEGRDDRSVGITRPRRKAEGAIVEGRRQGAFA